MLNYQYELKRITEIFLKCEDDYLEMKKAADSLHELFLAASGLQEDEDICRKNYFLPTGKAIGTVWAGMCVKEFLRTKKFIRGVFLGIKQVQEKFPNTRIHIIYAGAGPFATLLIPLTTVFSSEEVKFTFLEINQGSIKNLEKIIRIFGAEKYVEEIVQCDAAEYKADKTKPIHIVLTETMQNALKREPQVAITLNLAPQLVEGGILIPQHITVDAALIDPRRDMERIMGVEGADEDYCLQLNQIFDLNKDTTTIEKSEGNFFSEIGIKIPKDIERRYKRLSLLTNIQVFEEENLTYMQCSLNLPYKVMDIKWENNAVDKVVFQYVISENPGFVHKLVY
jgi:hypothetical protein